MQRPDVFAILLAVAMLGAGAYLSTFSAQVIRAIGVALMLVAIAGLVPWFMWERKQAWMTGFFLYAAVSFAVLSAVSVVGWVIFQRGMPQSNDVPEASILIDCFPDVLPTRANQEGRITILVFLEKADGSIEFRPTDYTFYPGSQIDWMKLKLLPSKAFRCDFNSVGTASIFESNIVFEANFREAVPYHANEQLPVGAMMAASMTKTVKSGPVSHKIDSIFRMRRIDPSPPVTMYIVNVSKYFLELKFNDAKLLLEKDKLIPVKKSTDIPIMMAPSLF